jgi:biotin carboxylase
LAELIARSLGAPAFYRTSVDKTLLSAAAAEMGVRVPPFLVTGELSEAEAFARIHGYPVVMKRGHSTAGNGVEICPDARALAQAFATLRRPDRSGLNDAYNGDLLVQAHIPGRIQYYAGVAWKGSLISGVAVEKIAGEPKGPSTVSRYFRSDTLRDYSAKLAQGFGMTGIFAPEFSIHERTGEPYLLELNRRMTHGTHRGTAMNVDPGVALFAAMTGASSTTRADLEEGEEHVCVHFPAEWLRDPQSRWLREHPVDVPWDEPELVQAMLALPRVL